MRPLDLVGRHHVVERVIERAQIRIDLLLHVAGQEAQPLAGLDRRPRQHDALDHAALQQHRRMGDREIGLAGAGRPDAEHQLGPLQRAHIGVLVERAGIDRRLARRDLRGRHLALALQRRQRQLVVGGDRHPDRAVDVRLGDVGALLQDAVEIVESPPRLLGRRGRTLDRQLVAARAYVDAELLLQPRQILVELPVKRARQPVVVEGEHDVRHVGSPGCRIGRRLLQFGSAQPSLLIGQGPTTCQTGSANRLLWPVLVIRTLTMSPISPAVSSTITGCSQGERPIRWPGWRPGFSIRTIDRPAGHGRAEVALLFGKQRLQALQAARPSPLRRRAPSSPRRACRGAANI